MSQSELNPTESTQAKTANCFHQMVGTIPSELTDELNKKQTEIVCYLFSLTEDESPTYTRSKRIAEKIGLTPREVGTNLNMARGKIEFLTIEKWGRSNSTTWKVSRETESNSD